MPKYMKISDVRRMSYDELKRWWEVDFDVLVTTAIAEATGEVHPTVSSALRSDDWVEWWADALYSGTGELLSSTERMAFTRDMRLAKETQRAGIVHQRMDEANRVLKARRAEQGWEMLGPHLKDAHLSALSILAKHHKQELEGLRVIELAQRDLVASNPMDAPSYKDVYDAIEDAVRQELISAPVGQAVRALLSAHVRVLTDIAAADVTDQQERCDELRHPLLLRAWNDALVHLRDRHCALAGIEPVFTITLPVLDVKALRLVSEAEAWAVINRRRFIRALAQRWRECQMRVRQMGRTAAERSEAAREPWYAAERAAREVLGHRHPHQLEALTAAFKPFCEPGTTLIRRKALSSRQRGQLIRELKQALEQGTWRLLLNS
ncbi:hypothetical protein [Streptomyces sp. NRRL S-378]|uniref:hypothetical protein n=1 Tax=Streptomyces sp. NRRL S-378 TaxID=1463904 RepID=UPI00131B34C3|nr:hypothetical protein [Streptomyces sp. NRRL S-378]